MLDSALRDFEFLCPYCYLQTVCDYIGDFYYCIGKHTVDDICDKYHYNSLTRLGTFYIYNLIISINFNTLIMKISEFPSGDIIYDKEYDRNDLLNFYNSYHLLK